MNSQSNLAFAIESEVLESAEVLNAVELDALLRLGSHQADVRPHTRARGRRAARLFKNDPFKDGLFKDNHSAAFNPFRIY